MFDIPTPKEVNEARERRLATGEGGRLVNALIEALKVGAYSVEMRYNWEAYMWAKEVFAAKGWELTHQSGDQREPYSRYTLREIKPNRQSVDYRDR